MKIRSVVHLFSLGLFLMTFSCHKEWEGEGSDRRRCFNSGGFRRCYYVYLPAAYDESKKYPLLLALHGRGGQGRGMDKFSGFNPVADEKEFIVCYPDGYSRNWADDRQFGPAADAGVDDIAFFDELIDRMIEDYSVDDKKVYAAGMSNGAFMSLSLACHLSDRIAAVAAVSGNMALDPDLWCEPSRPVPVLLIGGTADPIVPYYGGQIAESSECIGCVETFYFWRDLNGCFDFEQDSVWSDVDPDDHTTVQTHSHFGCDSAATVILYEVVGMGHTWPQGSQYLDESKIGLVSKEFNGAAVVAEFLLQFQLE